MKIMMVFLKKCLAKNKYTSFFQSGLLVLSFLIFGIVIFLTYSEK